MSRNGIVRTITVDKYSPDFNEYDIFALGDLFKKIRGKNGKLVIGSCVHTTNQNMSKHYFIELIGELSNVIVALSVRLP